MHEHLRRELQLTAEQNEKITPILDRLDQRMQAIRDETGHKVRDAMSRRTRKSCRCSRRSSKPSWKKCANITVTFCVMHGGEPPPPPPDGP